MRGRTATIASLVLFSSMALAQPQPLMVQTLLESGRTENRIDLVILGDGYRAEDQMQLSTDAQKLVDALFTTSPFSAYKAFFHVQLVHLVSVDNGADRGTFGEVRDTALDAAFWCGGVERLLCIDFGKALSIAAANVPDADQVLVVVNDPKYGGSGGPIAVASINSFAAGIVVHELGHSFTGLADEYETDSYDPNACSAVSDCPEPNATIRTTREAVKWSAWIPASYPVPTPAGAMYPDVGVYEGCRFQTKDIYRPKQDCQMRTIGAQFCEVCAEAVVRSIYERVRPLESSRPPASAALSACGETPLTFAVVPDPVVAPSASFLWTVNDAPSVDTDGNFTLRPTILSGGVNIVAVTLRDTTPLVRNDPEKLLTDQVSWTVRYDRCMSEACATARCLADGGCERSSEAPGTSCEYPSCVDGVRSGIGACDGDGGCAFGPPHSCGDYQCADDGTSCRTSCTQSGQCRNGRVCQGGECLKPAVLIPAAGDDLGPARSGSGCTTAGANSRWALIAFGLALVAARSRRMVRGRR